MHLIKCNLNIATSSVSDFADSNIIIIFNFSYFFQYIILVLQL